MRWNTFHQDSTKYSGNSEQKAFSSQYNMKLKSTFSLSEEQKNLTAKEKQTRIPLVL